MKALIHLLAAAVLSFSVVCGQTTGSTGSSAPFDTRQPGLNISYIICVQGSYPVRDASNGGRYFSGSDSIMGEIRAFSGNYAPGGWMRCEGQSLATGSNAALYSILGTTYGGNGSTTFNLPDLRNRVPIGADTNHPLGSVTGANTLTMTTSQMPAHTHSVTGGNTGSTGSGTAMSNMQASLALHYIIAPGGSFYHISEVTLFAGNFAPSGWMICDGRSLPVSQNTALYSRIGTTFGGNATNFNIPDLRGRTVIGTGQGSGLSNRATGQLIGTEEVTVTTGQLPAHTHTYSGGTTGSTGSGQSLANMQPSVALNHLIPLYGDFPVNGGGGGSDMYLGEIRWFAGSTSTLISDGEFIAANGGSVPDYETLFYIIGSSFGGDGVSTANAPDVRGRALVGTPSGGLGGQTGAENVTLITANLPVHTHTVAATGNSAPTNITLSPSSILEGNAANALIGTLTATDPDAGQTHSFSLVSGTGDTDNTSFTLSGNSVYIVPVTNAVMKSSYSLRVRATDNGSPAATFDKALTVTITATGTATSPATAWTVTQTTSGYDSVGGMDGAVDAAGNLFVVANEQTSADVRNIGITKFAPNGSKLWQLTHDHPSSRGPNTSTDQVSVVITDAAGDFYVGYRTDALHASAGNYAAVVMKVSGATGTVLWTTPLSNGYSLGSLNRLRFGPDGQLYAAGTGLYLPSTISTAWKLDPSNGNVTWRYSDPSGSPGSGINGTNDIAFDASGNPIFSGTEPILAQDPVAIKLDASTGAKIWKTVLGQNGSYHEHASGIVTNATGDVFVVSNKDAKLTTQRLNGSTGAILWTNQTGNAPNGGTIGTIRLDPGGNVIAVGPSYIHFPPSTSTRNILTRVDSVNGTTLWSVSVAAPGNAYDSVGSSDSMVVGPQGIYFNSSQGDSTTGLAVHDIVTGAQVFREVASSAGGTKTIVGNNGTLYTIGQTTTTPRALRVVKFSIGAVTTPDITVQQPVGTDLVFSSAAISFPTTNVSASSTAKTVTIKNDGTGPLSLGTVTKASGHTADFTLNLTGIASSLAAGASTTFTVAFSPTASGARSAVVRIPSDDPDEAPFDITVSGSGNAAPTLSLPASPIIAEATSASGAAVTFTATASDTEDGSLTPTLSHPSGSTFPVGDTTVNVSATDSGSVNVTGSFTVRVRDTTPPTISAPGAGFTPISFFHTATLPDYTGQAITADLVGVTSVVQTPAPGTTHAAGATVAVSLVAYDAAGNSSPAVSFSVYSTPPVNLSAEDDFITFSGASTTFNPLTNDTNPLPPAVSTLTIIDVGDPTSGTVTFTANSITYTRDGTLFDDQDSFTYTISDGMGGTDIGTIIVANYNTLAGSYTGLLDEGDGKADGIFRATVVTGGVLTGRAQLSGRTFGFNGVLDASGADTISSGGVTFQVQFHAPLTVPTEPRQHLTITANDAGNIFTGNSILHDYTNATQVPKAQIGYYHTAQLAQPAQTGLPTSQGWLRVLVTKNGSVTFAGRGPDVLPVSCASAIVIGDELAFYANGLNTNPKTRYSGLLSITLGGSITGTLDFDKAPQTANRGAYHAVGFSGKYDTLGGQYLAPLAGVRVLTTNALTQVDAIVTGGGFAAPFTKTFTLSTANIFSPLPQTPVNQLKVNRSGLLSGIIRSITNTNLPITGLVVPGLGAGSDMEAIGCFLYNTAAYEGGDIRVKATP